MKKITEKNTNTASVAVQTQLTLTDMNNIFNWNDVISADDYDADELNISEHSDTLDYELSNDDLGLLYEETLILVDEFLLSNPLFIGNATIETQLYHHIFPFIHYSVKLEHEIGEEEDEDDNDNDEEKEEEESFMIQLKEIVNVAISDYCNFIHPLKDSSCPNIEKMRKKIEFLESVYQPEQKTDEWYQHRHGLITASSVWKVFGSQSTQNQLIYEKCSPIDVEKYNRINTESSLHWGQNMKSCQKIFMK